MISALWKACAEGDLENVHQLLKDASPLDIEIKDHNGVTPLIEAIRNGHVEVVRALLDKGADPMNSSSHGLPEQYTSDPSVLELLNRARPRAISNGMPSQDPGYGHDPNDDLDKYHGSSPPVPYPYYPSINSAPPSMTEGGVYYPPPPQATAENPGAGGTGGLGNLPPPEVARFIPCRYFPACRYGSSCLFAHPQAPYFQGSLPPPAQYGPPYDPMSAQPYAPSYYPIPPSSFPSQNGVHHMAPLSPPPFGTHLAHRHSPSEVVPPVPTHFGANGITPPSTYPPMSPSTYSHPGQAPIPMSTPPLPALQQQPVMPPQSAMYNPATSPAPVFIQPDTANQYSTPPQPTVTPISFPAVNGDSNLPNLQTNSYVPGSTQPHRDGGHGRRGSARRGSFAGRKPPCLFFPAGRCKNGDDCRFPHVMPEGSGPHHGPHPPGRGGIRPRNGNSNGYATINEKFAGMTVREDSPRRQNVAENSSRSHSTDPGRPRYSQGAKNNHAVNGVRVDKKPYTVKQRVPNADEFPVLAGSTTPPTRSPGLNGTILNGNGHGAPTAAQVLQAPPPVRKDCPKESSTRGTTPDPVKSTVAKDTKPENRALDVSTASDQLTTKLPVSFAAIATAAPDISKEITLSA